MNILFPGFGSFMVGKWGQAIFQLLIGFLDWLNSFPSDLVLGVPICIAVRILGDNHRGDGRHSLCRYDVIDPTTAARRSAMG